MIALRMRLEGNFVESFLYYDFLWLLTLDGEVWAFDTAAYLENIFESDVAQAIMAFARNDRLPRRQKNKVDLIFQKKLAQQLGEGELNLTKEEVQKYSRIFKIHDITAKSILDFRCYYGRGFIATESNVIQLKMLGRSDLQHVHIGGKGNGALGGDKIADFRCRQLRTNLGMLSAAAGPDGGWYAAGSLSDDSGWRAKFEKFSERSIATEVMGGGMANVDSPSGISIFETDIHLIESNLQFDAEPNAKIISSSNVEDEENQFEINKINDINNSITEELNEVIKGSQEKNKTIFKKVFLSKSKVFALDCNQVLRSIVLARGNSLENPFIRTTFPAAPGSILSITFTDGGKTVAELDDKVCLLNFHTRQWETLFEGEVYSVRGYPGSKWYQNLLTCVGEDYTELMFIAS